MFARVRPGQPDRVDCGPQVAPDQRQVGGRDGDVGAGAHGQTEVGLDEGGGMIDAIADHGNDRAGVLQAADRGDLVFGHDLGDHLVHASLGGDGACRPVVVAGEQHRAEAERAQLRDGPG